MRRYLGLLLLTWSTSLVAQKNNYERIDSLLEVVNKWSTGTDRDEAITLHELATAYMHTSNYVQAAKYYAESLEIADRLKDEMLMALIYRNMSVLSSTQSDYKKASDYHKKALVIYEKRNDNIKKAELIKLMADNMLYSNDSLNARNYYREAIEVFKLTNNKLGEAMALSNYSLTFSKTYPEKLKLAIAAQTIFDSIYTENPIPAINAGNIGVAYFDIVRYEEFHLAPPGPLIPGSKKELLVLAEKYVRLAIQIAGSKQDVENAGYFTGVLAEIQEYNGDFKNAYHNIRKYYDTDDSIHSQTNKNTIAALQNKQEINLKNAEIETRKLQVRNQRTQLLLLAGGLLMVIIIGVFIFRESRLSKKNNRILQTLNKELAVANETKAKFSAILSHDLRSPIARLVSFLQFGKLKPDALSQEQQQQHEQKITDTAQALLSTMESMLIWSKDQMEHFQPIMKPVLVSSVFEYIRTNFSNIQSIAFEFDTQPELTLQTDENYLRTILYNLTSNAVNALKATSSPVIKWAAWKADDVIILSITDNGPGIPANSAAHFFENQVISDSSHGLGIQIVRDLSKAINCSLSVGSTDGGLTLLLRFEAFPTSTS